MQKIVLMLTCLLICAGTKVSGQESANLARDKEIVADFFKNVQIVENEPFGAIMVRTALYFLDTPYVGATLEVGDEERLTVNLRELDCTTFMETCVALSRLVQKNSPTFESYCKELQRIRYRNGMVNGYVSRLHYTSDWIFDNRAKGVVEDVTGKIGGKPYKVQLSYMSSHSEAYRHLKGKPERTARIRQIEELVNRRGTYSYIPKEEIPALQEQIHDGDIICFVTSTLGLDISHVGIASRLGETLSFIHASSTAKKVIVNPESLFAYCSSISSNLGIMVLRGVPVRDIPVLPAEQ